jgi:hypothetical protein
MKTNQSVSRNGRYRNAREMAIHTLLSLNGRARGLAWAKPDGHLSQKGQFNPLSL